MNDITHAFPIAQAGGTAPFSITGVVVQIITSFVPSILDPPTTLQNSTRICGADCTPSQIPLSQSRSN